MNGRGRILNDVGNICRGACGDIQGNRQRVIQLNTLDAELMQDVLFRVVGKIGGFDFLEQCVALFESISELGRDFFKVIGVEVVGCDVDVGLDFSERGLEFREG